MSIRNLLTNNLKPDQDLKVDSINANNINFSNLEISGDLQVDGNVNIDNNLDCGNLNAANIFTAGSFTVQICQIGNQIEFPNTIYNDLPLNTNAEYTTNVTWNVNGVNSGNIVNGIKFVRIGNIVSMQILPFSIVGASVSGPDLYLISNISIPVDFRPFTMPCKLGIVRYSDIGVWNPAIITVLGSGDYTIKFAMFDPTSTFHTGAMNFVFPDTDYYNYISPIP